MARKRKVKRTVLSAALLWLGRLLLHRVQRRTLKAVARKKKPEPQRGLVRRLRRPTSAPAPAPKRIALPRVRVPRRAAKGVGVALMSAVALAALKAGVGHVIEAERDQHVVTPDFDVFADDEE